MLEALTFIADGSYCAEEILNGRRLLVSKHGSMVHAFNRDRTVHVLPPAIVNLARSFHGEFVLDGELVRDSFIAFDVIEACHVNVSAEPFVLRRKLLARISPFPVVAHATGEKGKAQLLESVRDACGHGVAFKRLDVPYDSGHESYGIQFDNYRIRSLHTDDRSIQKHPSNLSGVGSAGPSHRAA
jgi:ATP-dependent DNA ligase